MKRKTIGLAAAVAGAVTAAVVYAAAPGKAEAGQKAPFYGRYFAHRGLHDPDGSAPENSLTAFRLAANKGYGVELDVHLTADGQVVVFHDTDLERMTGMTGDIETFTYAQLRQLRLADTAETIPLLTEVLEVIDGAGPIILEVKPYKQWTELCEKTAAILDGYPGDVCVECFDPRVPRWFKKHAPGYLRGQLAMPAGHYQGSGASKVLAFLSSRCLLNFLGRPQFIAYEIGPKPLTVRLSEKLGAMRVCWTSRHFGDEPGNDAVIFEHYRPARYLPKPRGVKKEETA